MDLDIKDLIKFLSNKQSIKISMENDTGLPYLYIFYGPSWIPVLCYVLKFISDSEDEENDDATLIQTIRLLADFARAWFLLPKQILPTIFLQDFVPKVQKYFKVPINMPLVLQFNRNEILAAFLDFLLQIWNTRAHRKYDGIQETKGHEEAWPKKLKHALHQHDLYLVGLGDYTCNGCDEMIEGWSYYCEECDFVLHPMCGLEGNVDDKEEDQDENNVDEIQNMSAFPQKNQMCDLLHVELKFLLSFLGDVPFQCYTTHRHLNTVLDEFEVLANEVGHFTLFFILAPHLGTITVFDEVINKLMKKVELLKKGIEQYCISFHELIPMHVTIAPTVTIPIDSLFIVHSLLGDLESVIDRRFHVTVDADMNDQIGALYEELIKLSRAFLKHTKLVSQETKSCLLKECFINIREIAYEAEYLVSSYVVGNTPSWYMRARLPVVVRKLKHNQSKFHEITDSVSWVAKDFTGKVSLGPTETTTPIVEGHLVGIDDTKNEILDKLTGGSKALQIVSLIGMPGLGKTSIARNLFDSSSVRNHFDKRAWCVISKNYVRKKSFLEILMALTSDEEKKKQKLEDIEDEKLGVMIHKSLYNRRYLIIIDDIWTSNTWNDIRRYFPDGSNGSRIMLTSRNKDATPVKSIFPTLRPLSEVESTTLLMKKVFLDKPCPPRLLVVGNKISKGCKGLPLAIVAIAGVLANLDMEESSWTEVEKNLSKFMLDVQGGCMKVLELSYEHLPDHLKMCFIYLGTFPEDGKIPVGKILKLWIAEGFIKRVQGKSPEDVAKEYLHDLINRSLVLIVKKKFNGGVKECGIHDLFRDLCLQKVDEGNFMKSTKKNLSMYMRHHRLRAECDEISSHFGLHCRSFSGHLLAVSSCLPQMPLNRVIDLLPDKICDNKELVDVDKLVHLRFLCAPKRILSPQSASNLLNLEVLDVSYLSGYMIALSIILKMVKLKHLKIRSSQGTQIINDCDNCKITNLQSLSRIKIYDLQDDEFLKCCPRLQNLKCMCGRSQFPDFGSLTELETLNLRMVNSARIHLTTVNFPSTIKKLTLESTGLPWDEVSRIGRLTNLQVLNLIQDAFVGAEWETNDGEFKKLKVLKLHRISSLEQWITYSSHFPELQCLVLDNCKYLQDITSDLGDIPTLLRIEVNNCSYMVSKCALQIEQKQHEDGNEELEAIIISPYWSKKMLMFECKTTKAFFRRLSEGCTGSKILSEMISAGLNVGSAAETQFQGMINAYGDGNIDLPDFLDLVAKIRVSSSGYVYQKAFNTFKQYNLDSDDASGLYKWLRYIGQMVNEEEVGKMVREVNADGDGRLKYDEFKKLMMTIDFPRPNDLRTVLGQLLQYPREDDKVQELKAAFNSFGFKDDDCITTDELCNLITYINENNATEAQLQNMMNKMDVNLNGNGTINLYQFLCIYLTTFDDGLQKEFEHFDKDNDGFISVPDMFNAMKEDGYHATEEEVEEIIRMYDADGDGQTNFQEFVNCNITMRLYCSY